MNYVDLSIAPDCTLRAAMQQLDRTGKRILFVVENNILVGTLTDGDIRRYLLKEGKLSDQVIAAANCHPQTAKNYEQAYALLRADGQTPIPIVDRNGTLLDIVLEQGILEPVYPDLALPVVIMAGGKGTRLDPYTRILPKPLIPVGNLPVIEHIMQRFVKYGCRNFNIIVNYKKQLIKAYFNETEQPYNVSWYDEERPLGTGGGLSLLKETVQQTFFLTNCDTLLRTDYSDILRFHRENRNIITMVGVYKNLTLPYGILETGDHGVVKVMREKPELSFLTNSGMYIVEPEVLNDIQDNTAIGFPDIIEEQRKKGNKVAVYPVRESEWLDAGQLDELTKMEAKLNSRGELG